LGICHSGRDLKIYKIRNKETTLTKEQGPSS
jgi:hypothetical protein